MCPDEVLLSINLPLPLRVRGKVRDVYELGEHLLFVASDRISAFDCILGSGIPCKGRVLTQMSAFWFELLRDTIPSHLVTADVTEYPRKASKFRKTLEGRSMLVKKAAMIEIECVARGYLAGSGWKEYAKQGRCAAFRCLLGCGKASAFPNRFLRRPQRRKPGTM